LNCRSLLKKYRALSKKYRAFYLEIFPVLPRAIGLVCMGVYVFVCVRMCASDIGLFYGNTGLFRRNLRLFRRRFPQYCLSPNGQCACVSVCICVCVCIYVCVCACVYVTYMAVSEKYKALWRRCRAVLWKCRGILGLFRRRVN